MEICGIDSGVNVCIIKMTFLVDDLELKMPENGGGGGRCVFNAFA